MAQPRKTLKTGTRFGHLVVERELPGHTKSGVMYECLCDCGRKHVSSRKNLTGGETNSCGCRRKGVFHSKWKGGRSLDGCGYVRVYCPNHPRTQNGRYVREHVLAMERKLGRYMFPEETVHHKNGVRDDNRIENLELWTSRHTPGQRVEDMVEFWTEMLRRYAPERLV